MEQVGGGKKVISGTCGGGRQEWTLVWPGDPRMEEKGEIGRKIAVSLSLSVAGG